MKHVLTIVSQHYLLILLFAILNALYAQFAHALDASIFL